MNTLYIVICCKYIEVLECLSSTNIIFRLYLYAFKKEKKMRFHFSLKKIKLANCPHYCLKKLPQSRWKPYAKLPNDCQALRGPFPSKLSAAC